MGQLLKRHIIMRKFVLLLCLAVLGGCSIQRTSSLQKYLYSHGNIGDSSNKIFDNVISNIANNDGRQYAIFRITVETSNKNKTDIIKNIDWEKHKPFLLKSDGHFYIIFDYGSFLENMNSINITIGDVVIELIKIQ